MDYNKIRSFCRIFRIAIGLVLIAAAFFIGDSWENSQWLYLGVIPLLAGAVNFCPLCIISKKCDLPKNEETTNESN
ncbi:DUF2892 domain-containing protein [Sulfurimonas sp. SAG-AH-194-C21]|nr:DUF2892 domain-containing protein [Sulfurimonas sp. SAG-AH-194-C21]MDF1884452.1 DUF2892 domain-containing protein [Sulfurimonas sp. SAG-AH-194-C21]